MLGNAQVGEAQNKAVDRAIPAAELTAHRLAQEVGRPADIDTGNPSDSNCLFD